MDRFADTGLTCGEKEQKPKGMDKEKLVSHRQVVESCMNRLLLVALKDGRLIEGRLDCYDQQGNMILINASDVTRETDRPFGRSFRLGTVMVPGGVTSQVLLHTQKDCDAENARPKSQHDYVAAAVGKAENSSQQSLGAFGSAKAIEEKQDEQAEEKSAPAK